MSDGGMGALLGIVIGAILGGAVTIFVDYFKEVRERKAIAAALAAEISSMMMTVQTKQMVPFFRVLSVSLKSANPPPPPWVFLDAAHEKRPVAKAHIGRVGQLGPGLARRVVTIHGLLDAVNLEVKILASGFYNNNPPAAATIIDRGLLLWDQAEAMAQPLIDDLTALSGE